MKKLLLAIPVIAFWLLVLDILAYCYLYNPLLGILLFVTVALMREFL